jgi:hypothetical protein
VSILDGGEDEQTTTGGRRLPPVPLRLAFGVIAAAWVVAAPWTLLAVLGQLLSWLSDQFSLPFTTPSFDLAEAQRVVTTGGLVGTVIPLTGFLLALVFRRPVAAVLFGSGVLIGSLLWLCLHAVVTPDEPDRSPWPDPPGVCQERSGGDTDCPGG